MQYVLLGLVVNLLVLFSCFVVHWCLVVKIFSSSLAYFSQGAGDRTPLRGPFSPRRHMSSFVILCEPGFVVFLFFCCFFFVCLLLFFFLGGAMGVFLPRHPVG